MHAHLIRVLLLLLHSLSAAPILVTCSTPSYYSYNGGLSCSPCQPGGQFISAGTGCQPGTSFDGPTDTAFAYSGDSREGYSAFNYSSLGATPFVVDNFGNAGGALSLASGSFLFGVYDSARQSPPLPFSNNPWTVMATVQCLLPPGTLSAAAVEYGSLGSYTTAGFAVASPSANGLYTPSLTDYETFRPSTPMTLPCCDGKWHVVTITHGDTTATNVSAYVDGILVGTSAITYALPSSGQIFIGTPLSGPLDSTPLWVTGYAVGATFGAVDMGAAAFNALFAISGVARRICKACPAGYSSIYYKRIAPIVTFNAYNYLTSSWLSADNIMNTHFLMFSSYTDMLAGTNPFSFCNYDDAPIAGFRDCSPSSGGIGNLWYSRSSAGGVKDVSFQVLTYPSASNRFSGAIRDVRIYSRALTAFEALQLSQPLYLFPTSTNNNNNNPSRNGSMYTWTCNPGVTGLPATLVRAPSDYSWSWQGGTGAPPSCAVCAPPTYSIGGSLCSVCPTSTSTYVSYQSGCAPLAGATSGPPDTSYYFSGSKAEGVSAFITTNPGGISFGSDSNNATNGAVYLNEAQLSGFFSGWMPSGQYAAFTVSAFVNCSLSMPGAVASAFEFAGSATTSTFTTAGALLVASSSRWSASDYLGGNTGRFPYANIFPVCDGTWHHIAISATAGSPSTVRAYVDGRVYGTSSSSFNLPSTGILTIGTPPGGPLSRPGPWIRVFATGASSGSYDAQQAFTDSLFNQSLAFRRLCNGCSLGYTEIYYKRLTPFPAGFSAYTLMLLVWPSLNNTLKTDFALYSSYSDFLAGTNPFLYCSYDNPAQAFPGQCGKSASVLNQWNKRGTVSVTFAIDYAFDVLSPIAGGFVPFNGATHSLRVYSRSLSDAEVAQIALPMFWYPNATVSSPVVSVPAAVTTLSWSCPAGFTGLGQLSNKYANAARVWSDWTSTPPICTPCTGAGPYYSYGGPSTTQCSLCPPGATLMSSITGCRPNPVASTAPTDAAFSLSGRADEGLYAFSKSASGAALSFGTDAFGVPGGALVFQSSSGGYTAGPYGAPFASSPPYVPTGAQFTGATTAAFVRCNLTNPNLTAPLLEWGGGTFGSTPGDVLGIYVAPPAVQAVFGAPIVDVPTAIRNLTMSQAPILPLCDNRWHHASVVVGAPSTGGVSAVTVYVDAVQVASSFKTFTLGSYGNFLTVGRDPASGQRSPTAVIYNTWVRVYARGYAGSGKYGTIDLGQMYTDALFRQSLVFRRLCDVCAPGYREIY